METFYAADLEHYATTDHLWLCRELGLSSGRPSIWMGEGGNGKSFWARACALAMAGDAPLLGRFFFDDCRRVCIIDNEGGSLRVAALQLKSLALGLGVDFSKLEKRLCYVQRPVAAWHGEDAQETLLGLADHYDVLFVDAYRGCLRPGTDENALGACEPLDMATEIAEQTGAAIVFVDHISGKGESPNRTSPRGHSSKRDASGTILDFQRDNDTAPTQVTCRRAQLLPCDEWPEPFAYRLQRDGDAVRVADAGPERAPAKPVARVEDVDAVVDVVRKHRGLGNVEAVAKLMPSGRRMQQPVRQALRVAEAQRLIERRHDGFYWLCAGAGA